MPLFLFPLLQGQAPHIEKTPARLTQDDSNISLVLPERGSTQTDMLPVCHSMAAFPTIARSRVSSYPASFATRAALAQSLRSDRETSIHVGAIAPLNERLPLLTICSLAYANPSLPPQRCVWQGMTWDENCCAYARSNCARKAPAVLPIPRKPSFGFSG